MSNLLPRLLKSLLLSRPLLLPKSPLPRLVRNPRPRSPLLRRRRMNLLLKPVRNLLETMTSLPEEAEKHVAEVAVAVVAEVADLVAPRRTRMASLSRLVRSPEEVAAEAVTIEAVETAETDAEVTNAPSAVEEVRDAEAVVKDAVASSPDLLLPKLRSPRPLLTKLNGTSWTRKSE